MKTKKYYKAFLNVLRRKSLVSDTPIHIQLEPTSYCNLSCRSCSYKEMVKNPRHLSFEKFKEILDSIKPLKLTLSGVGETFLNPEIFKMVEYAKANGVNVNTSSNGTLIDKLAEQIVDSGLDLLKISIDSDNAETYNKVRDDDYFDKVIDGVKELVRIKKLKGYSQPYVRFQFVIQQANYREIAGVVKLASDLGVDAINFQILEITGIEDRADELVGNMSYDDLMKSLEEGQLLSKELSVLTNLEQVIRKMPDYWKKYSSNVGTPEKCILPWFSTYIDVDGNLKPCCTFGLTFTEADMGNLLTDGIEEAWNGEKYKKFRDSIKDGTVPYVVCKRCHPQTAKDIIEMSKILPGFLKKGK